MSSVQQECMGNSTLVAERRTSKEIKGCDTTVANGAYMGKIPFFFWILCHRFLERERSQKSLEGGFWPLFLGKITS